MRGYTNSQAVCPRSSWGCALPDGAPESACFARRRQGCPPWTGPASWRSTPLNVRGAAVAIYRLEAKVIGRTSGRSACAAAAYRAAERIVDQRTGQVHDYARRGGVEHAEILAPETAPAWVQDRAALWNAVEAAETRRNAQLARELVLTLPRELTPEQRLETVRSFVSAELNRVYFEKRSFSSSGSRVSLTQRQSAMTKGSRFRRPSKSAARWVRSSALAWQW